jgi:hypothetical protein
MQLRKLIQRRIRTTVDGVEFQGDLNAVVAANVGERSQTTRVHGRSTAVSTQSKHDEGEIDRDEEAQA